MKPRYLTIAIFALLVGCASRVPAAVMLAQEKQAASLQGAHANITAFTEAALKDLENALLTQINREFDARLNALCDETGKAPLDKVKAEIALADEARASETERVKNQMGKFRAALKDLDNAIKLNEILGEYLSRDFISAQDMAELIRRIDKITGGQ